VCLSFHPRHHNACFWPFPSRVYCDYARIHHAHVVMLVFEMNFTFSESSFMVLEQDSVTHAMSDWGSNTPIHDGRSFRLSGEDFSIFAFPSICDTNTTSLNSGAQKVTKGKFQC
jgi:hypothetical protein